MRQEEAAVIVLSVVVFLVLMGLTLITPALLFYAREFGATATMVGLLISGSSPAFLGVRGNPSFNAAILTTIRLRGPPKWAVPSEGIGMGFFKPLKQASSIEKAGPGEPGLDHKSCWSSVRGTTPPLPSIWWTSSHPNR